MLNITTVKLSDLVPDSIKSDPEVAACIAALENEINLVSGLCSLPSLYANIDTLDSKTLDHMAWQVDSKVWRDSWPVLLKRSVIKTVILEKAKKGTRNAVENAINSLGSNAVIREWFEYDPPKTPHTFDVIVTLGGVVGGATAEAIQDVRLRIDDTKPARALYDLQLAIQATGHIGFIGGLRPAVYTRLSGIEQ